MIAPALILLALAGPVALAPRTPADQAHLATLAEALGRAHALHRLCAGPADDLWRAKMGKLLEVERPDPGSRQRLTDAFNRGFAAGGADFATCSPQSRNALSQVERQAALEARSLAGGGATKSP